MNQVSTDWTAVPFWTSPLEQCSADAIAMLCDADRRGDIPDTMIVRLGGAA